jgi:parallel beta-helix repeat protein
MFPGFDAGIAIQGGNATHNLVSNNQVIGNCGDGITFNTAANTNTVSGNTVLESSELTYAGRCFTVPPGTFFDAADRWPGTVNIWDPNNCHTGSPGVPATACQ